MHMMTSRMHMMTTHIHMMTTRMHMMKTCMHILWRFSETSVGSHTSPIRCVEFASEVNMVVSGSWDTTVKLWDPRGPSAAGILKQQEKAYYFSTA